MLRLFRSVFWAFMRLLLSFRYRVRVHGRKQLRGLKGPVVVFPNHPGYIDPALVLSQLWPTLHLKPVLYEGLFLQPGYFRTPLAYPLIKFLGALLVPDLNRPSARARARAEQAVNGVIEGLARGERYILWPSGHVQRDGAEHLRAARALTDILRAAPDATVVLVRTRGLWGSMFTYAQTGQRPPLMGRLWAGLGWLLANLLLFMPRRRIDITVEILDRGKLPPLERDAVNRWFEAWYNQGGTEQPVYVPYHRLFGARSYEFPGPASAAAAPDVSRVTAETRAEVAHILERKLGEPLDQADQEPETTFDQLGLDSLGVMEITLAVEQRFGFASAQAPTTLGELWLLAQGLAEEPHPQPAPPEWSRQMAPPSPAPPPTGGGGVGEGGTLQIRGETLGEAFVNQALAHPHDVAVADDLAGVLTYRRLLVGVLTLARRFARLPGTRVGLLLPASAACDTALLALQLAGKVPVVLNWTTGPANLAHAARAMGLTHVVTSEAFLDRTGVQIDEVEFVTLEEVRQGISRWELLRTLLGVKLLPGRVRSRVPKAAPDQPAVILFTSGSEKAPKAVPLTHANLLSNQRAALALLGLTRKDCVLGFLPAFHSFGLTLTGLLPLLAGIRVVRHPDPTGAATLARKTAAYRPTLLAGTPTFLGAILGRATPEQLASLRLLFVGAEKCPPALREKCREMVPNAQLLEGYGITECGPMVAVNRPGANRPGTVGQPVPGMEVRVVDPETEEELPPGRVGELWVSGPSVFPGYLAYEGESPFRERHGRRWYVTGDLAEVDAEGFIRLAGRKKRFLKAGGEMISLPALEEPLARLYPPTERGPRVAVEGVETAGGRRVVLFSTEPLGLREANTVLHDEGFRGVMRLDEVRRVPAIPVLGTGKTDYKVLRALITSAEPAPELVSR
jgi:acyl-CoA synthetase (AMP-forming)/AMP-acid ligase II/1-acyl-sn-glycerol-3-phosphate acyltransferase/acyl carrier protein